MFWNTFGNVYFYDRYARFTIYDKYSKMFNKSNFVVLCTGNISYITDTME